MISAYFLEQTTAFWLIAEFILCSAAVIFVGIRVARYGDEFGEKAGLSKAWVGAFLLATVTSFPELISSVGSITLLRAPNLAFGNIFGSNLFNVMIICLLDVYYRSSQSILSVVSQRHILTAALGVILMMMAMMGLLLTEAVPPSVYFIFSLMIVVGFAWGSHLVYRHEKRGHEVLDAEIHKEKIVQVAAKFFCWAILIVFLGLWLIVLGDKISEFPFQIAGAEFVLGRNLVGIFLLAIVTSLPEVIISIEAVRLGSLDMALGNVFGSNICNVFFIPILDVIYKLKYGTSIFFDVAKTHIFSASLAILLTTIAIAGLIYSTKHRKKFIGWEATIMLLVYFLGAIVLYQLR